MSSINNKIDHIDHIKHKDQKWVFYKDIEGVAASEGVVRRVLAYCDSMMCVENCFETGAVGPVHSHPHTQITYVAQGRFRFTIGDEVREVGKGDTLCKQDGIRHGCVCLEKGILVDFFTPMREDFI
ncbi:MAG: cupin domain-containing protein [Treponema sp.]|nr:cupin domain-containing protein [Treponema sp.]